MRSVGADEPVRLDALARVGARHDGFSSARAERDLRHPSPALDRDAALGEALRQDRLGPALRQREHEVETVLQPRRVVAAITGEAVAPAGPGPRGPAAALRASLDRTSVLTGGERHLLEELLDRIADGE